MPCLTEYLLVYIGMPVRQCVHGCTMHRLPIFVSVGSACARPQTLLAHSSCLSQLALMRLACPRLAKNQIICQSKCAPCTQNAHRKWLGISHAIASFFWANCKCLLVERRACLDHTRAQHAANSMWYGISVACLRTLKIYDHRHSSMPVLLCFVFFGALSLRNLWTIDDGFLYSNRIINIHRNLVEEPAYVSWSTALHVMDLLTAMLRTPPNYANCKVCWECADGVSDDTFAWALKECEAREK